MSRPRTAPPWRMPSWPRWPTSCADGPAGFDIGLLSKQGEEWVLITQVRDARQAGRLLVLHPGAHRRHALPAVGSGVGEAQRQARTRSSRPSSRDQFRRAVLAFPDEDVLVGTRFIDPGGFQAFKGLEDICPRPGHKPTRRGAGLEPAPGQALRRRGPHRRPHLHRHRRRQRRRRASTSRRPSPRASPPTWPRFFEAARPRARRRAHRLRLGHGRGPGQQVLALTVPGSTGPAPERRWPAASGPGQQGLDHLVAATVDRRREGDQAGGRPCPRPGCAATGAVHAGRPCTRSRHGSSRSWPEPAEPAGQIGARPATELIGPSGSTTAIDGWSGRRSQNGIAGDGTPSNGCPWGAAAGAAFARTRRPVQPPHRLGWPGQATAPPAGAGRGRRRGPRPG